MRNLLQRLLLVLILASLLSIGTFAGEKPTFDFVLAVDGEREVAVSTGDIITVTLTLRRTDSQKEYTMHAMQDEICYDKSFFRLVEDSDQPAEGVRVRDMALRDHRRAHYLNYVSMAGGRVWNHGCCPAGKQESAGLPSRRKRQLCRFRAGCDCDDFRSVYGKL